MNLWINEGAIETKHIADNAVTTAKLQGARKSTGTDNTADIVIFNCGTSTTVPFNEAYSIEQIDADIVPMVEEITGDSNIHLLQSYLRILHLILFFHLMLMYVS